MTREYEVFGVHPNAPLVVLNTYGDEGAEVFTLTEGMSGKPFTLMSIHINDWNRSMSPWGCPPVFGDEPFTGGADEYLEELTGTLIPSAVDRLGYEPSSIIIAGYSLAGLFALYASCMTDVFDASVSASGSLWYPGFLNFIEKNSIRSSHVYLSLGDKEPKTRNPIMSAVGTATEKVRDILVSEGTDAFFEYNPGNHFRDASLRTAKGIAWTLERIGDRTQ